jgi:hypothetical protein
LKILLTIIHAVDWARELGDKRWQRLEDQRRQLKVDEE